MGVLDPAPGPAGGRASEAPPPSEPQRTAHLGDTDTSDETNLRRANNSALQTALQILGAHNFASNDDRQWWIAEHYRQACLRASQDRRSAS